MPRKSVTVERVAESRDELAILAAVVDRPTDDVARLVYADWLEERNDARGPFLRRFVEAYRAGKDLPDLNAVPPAWADLTGLTIHHKLVVARMKKWRSKLVPLARPAIRLDVTEANFDDPPQTPVALGTTRLGGDPDLPRRAAYPTTATGEPLHFLGQFDLADLQGTIAGRAFPEAGLLSIFRPESDGKNCYVPAENDPRLVRFTPPGTKLARHKRPPGRIDRPAPFRPGLRLVETLRLPAEYREWPGVNMTYEQASKLDAVFPTNLGGTAFILLGHATHGNVGVEPLKDRPDWHQLLLLPYFEGPDYGISDMSLSYHLPAADLKAGRFDRLETTFG